MATLTDLIHGLKPHVAQTLGEFFTSVVVTFSENEFTIESVVAIEVINDTVPRAYRLTQTDGNVVEISPSYVMVQFQPLRK